MWKTELLKNCRRIDTGLTAPKGTALIDSILGQLSDGYWENSPKMNSYWLFIECEPNINGTVDICVSQESGQMYCGRYICNKGKWLSPAKLLKWFADKIYTIAKAEEKDWKESDFKLEKGNTGISQYLGNSENELTGNDVWELRRVLSKMSKEVE